MLITTVCSHCDATLKAPESVLGKRVKCTKCGKPFVARLPGDDDAEEPLPRTVKMKAPAPSTVSKRRSNDDEDEDTEESPPAKRRKPVRRDDDDEDTEDMQISRSSRRDDEDAPKPKFKKKGKKGKKKPAGPPVMLFVLIGIGALVLIGGGIGVYFGFIKEDSKPTTPTTQTPGGPGTPAVPAGPPAAATEGWVEINETGGKYKLKFPMQPLSQNMPQQTPAGPVALKVYVLGGQTEVFLSTHQPVLGRGGLSDDALLDQAVQMSRAQAKGAAISNTTTITYQSFPGREFVMNMAGKKGSMVVRAILASDRIIVLTAGGDTASATSPRVKAFFESLRIE